MIARLGELERTIANMIRPGKIIAAKYSSPPRVKVQIGANQTGWLPWGGSRASGDRSWDAPEIGEQVLVLSPSGDYAQGFVLPGIYQDDYLAPADSPDIVRRIFKDGALIEYNRAGHVLTANLTAAGKSLVITGQTTTEQTNAHLKATIGAAVSIEATASVITLTANGFTIVMDPAGIKATVGGSVATMTPQGIELTTT